MLTIEKQRGKQEISTVCTSFLKSICFSIVFAARYLSSNSMSVQKGGGLLLSKSGQTRIRGGMGLKTGKNVRTSSMDDPL